MLLSLVTFGQEQTTKTDTIVPKKERYGIRFGVDLFKLTRSFYEDLPDLLELVPAVVLGLSEAEVAELSRFQKRIPDGAADDRAVGFPDDSRGIRLFRPVS